MLRTIRGLCLAMLAGLAIVAFAGSGSATATVLCKANENPECIFTNTWLSGTIFELKRKSFDTTFTTSLFTVTCKKTTNEVQIGEGTPLPIQVSNLTFGECSSSCTVTARNLPYEGSISPVGSGDGTITLVPREGANPSVKAVCGALTCIYGAEEISLYLKRGMPGSAEAITFGAEVWREEPTEGCPVEATWSVSYEIVAGAGIYVV